MLRSRFALFSTVDLRYPSSFVVSNTWYMYVYSCRVSFLSHEKSVRCIKSSYTSTNRVTISQRETGCAGRLADHARTFRTMPAGRPAGDRRVGWGNQSVQSEQSMQPVIPADPFSGSKASILLAGKCRREGCVSKRHFAAPGVARRVVGGDIIAREEPRGWEGESSEGEISRQSESNRERERERVR